MLKAVREKRRSVLDPLRLGNLIPTAGVDATTPSDEPSLWLLHPLDSHSDLRTHERTPLGPSEQILEDAPRGDLIAEFAMLEARPTT